MLVERDTGILKCVVVAQPTDAAVEKRQAGSGKDLAILKCKKIGKRVIKVEISIVKS